MFFKLRYLVVTFLFLFIVSAYAQLRLPNIGKDSGYQIAKEKKIGEQFKQQLDAANKILEDPLVDFYVNDMLAVLLQGLDENYRSYEVKVINDLAINAFAVPGGFIGVNLGLILEAKNESQLAGVLAHEIAHIELGHIVQLLEKRDEIGQSVWASFLLALLVSQSDSVENKNEAVEAIVFGGTAGAQQALINFTRENEYEADRKGLEILKDSDYSTKGMAEFFSILEGKVGLNDFESIEYLRTHPISTNRIAEALDYSKKLEKNKKRKESDYEYLKIYINHLIGYNYQAKSLDKTILDYERALGLLIDNKHHNAMQELKNLYSNDKENIWVLMSLVMTYMNLNMTDTALETVDEALNIYVDHEVLINIKLKLLMQKGNYDQALIVAKKALSKSRNDHKIRFQLVKIYEKLGFINESREAEGDYLYEKGNLVRAKYIYKALANELKNGLRKERVIEKIKKIDKKDKANLN